MSRGRIEAWCDRACHYLYYPPDREDVRTELVWHLEDSCLALEEQGLTPEAAEEKALAGMGSAEEVGHLLRRVHKPWLGWLLFATSLLVAVVIFFVLVSLMNGSGSLLVSEVKRLAAHDTMSPEGAEEMASAYGDFTLAAALDWDGERVPCGRYTFDVTGAWLLRDAADDGRELLIFELEYRSPRFWLGRPEGFSEFFCVEESGGAVHPPWGWPYGVDDNVCIGYNGGSTAWGTVWGRVFVESGAEWYDLHYAHGQGFTIRLTVPEA
ncbi:MAG: permease prefix domain 1-containing protein [Oscillospiraceae bacterium]